MNWRLGLDLGTNSIGWAVIKLKDKKPVELTDIGSRIFSDGREPAREGRIGEPLALARRLARGMRNNIRRRKLRRRALVRQLIADGLFPQDKEKRLDLKNLDPYELRVRGLDKKLKPAELGRALFHLGVRRGFKSNRKDTEKDSQAKKELEGNAAKTALLYEKIKEAKARTLGEFLAMTRREGDEKNKKIFAGAKHAKSAVRFYSGSAEYYPVRKMYEDEFNLIRKKQEPYYPNVHWDAIGIIILSQRGLKPQQRGKCQFMTEYDRAYKALPSLHRFRILQEINNLVMYDELNQPVLLSNEQRQTIFELLENKKEVKFDAIRKKLRVPYRFNLESELRSFLKGNETSVTLRGKNYFGALWDELSAEEQDRVVESLMNLETDGAALESLAEYDLPAEQKGHIVKHVFRGGTAGVCKEFAQSCNKIMHEEWIRYYEAAKKMGYDHWDDRVKQYDILPYYGKILSGSTIGGDPAKGEDKPEEKYGRIGNPTVHVALNQVRTVVNALIKEYGKPRQIVVEVARKLKASREEKANLYKQQTENAKRNRILNRSIIEANPHIKYPNRSDRLKYKLWEELGTGSSSRQCVYCGKTISAGEIFSSNIEIEHILPYSRTLMDGESNLTLAHKKCNAIKGERSPWEAFFSNPSGYNWEEICSRAARLPKRKQARFSSDAMENKGNDFIDRQLTDNAYLSRISRRYLTSVCDDVWVAAGGMTKLLRDKWKIDEILKRKITGKEIAYFGLDETMIGSYKKNRYDHRHHALDAMVIGLVERSLVQEIARKNAVSNRSSIEVPPCIFARGTIAAKVRDMVVSFKPEHGIQGKLSLETALGRIKREREIPMAKLTEEMVPAIKSAKIRSDFEEEIKKSDFKNAKKNLKPLYPLIRVNEFVFVNRNAITGLNKREHIATIIDLGIQRRLYQFLDDHPDLEFQKALERFSRETMIRKLRCQAHGQSPIKIERDKNNPNSVDRYYNPLDYFAAIIWEVPPSKNERTPSYTAQYIRRNELDRNGKPVDVRPHPAAKKICTLFKKDYLELYENKRWIKAIVGGFSASNNKLDIRPLSAANTVKDWIISTAESMLEPGWKETGSQQNYVSVNVIFGKKSARHITVNPIGRVFRRHV